MNKKFLNFGLALFLCGFLLVRTNHSALGEGDAIPKPFLISFVYQRTTPEPFTGTWNASGLFADAGTAQQSFFLSGPFLPETNHIDDYLTSDLGAIHIRSHVSINWSSTDYPDHTAQGVFTIISGTGAYEGLQGGGTVSTTVDFTPVQTPTGPGYQVVLVGTFDGMANFAP